MDRSRRSRSKSPRRDSRRDHQDHYSSRRSRSKSPHRRHRNVSEERHPYRGRSRSKSPPAKRRHPSPSRSRSRDRKRRRERADSVSSSSSSDSRRKKRKDEKRSKSKERERRERKEKKREKKERKEKKKKAGAHTSQWGKYGIISEVDIFSKTSEFQTWLVEERKINPETISKDQNKKEFSRFIEDYNTATLPHEKYYNMEAFERRMAGIRAGEILPPADDSYNAQEDMKALSNAHKKKKTDSSSYLTTEHLMELRKVQNERVQAGKMKLLGMDIKQSMGVIMVDD
ncbi:hypothetical protein BDP27DRAFT_1256229 [Rhodocollybia butyracea]|uniref:Uncharacterized protein n=1 Tax=Rhodocollybia butyracea TaxID=206335 RepID=A0A9P5UEH9_9AGAR|nr:hypothetical protein BDP27DRAFT_1256229 [Rhodocollybia butyracea]